jgi:hypothetical protein
MRTLSIIAVVVGSFVAASPTAAQGSSTASATSTLRDPFRSPRRAITAQAKAGPPPAAPAFTATSLIIAGEHSVATLRSSGRFMVVGVGDWIDGWRVVGMSETGVELRFGSGQGSVAHLVLQRYTRTKAGKSSTTATDDQTYAAGNGGALPGGDLPLLPEFPVMRGADRPANATVKALDERIPSRADQMTVPRLVPNP